MEFILIILTIITIFIAIILKRWDEIDWDDFEFEFDFSLILETIAISLSHIEMFFKRIIKRNYYKDLNEEYIPDNTLYCYSGTKRQGACPYLDYPKTYKLIRGCNRAYCHYIKGGMEDYLLYDQCKICGINEEEE